MNKAHFLAAVMFAASVLVTPARTQDTPRKGAALKPAPSASEALLVNWNETGRKLIAMAEDFPEDRYDFKPAPSARTFSERLLHAAAANYFFTNMALGQKPPSEEDPKRDLFKSKADLVAYVKKSFADGAAAIKSKGDKGISGVVVDPLLRMYRNKPAGRRYDSAIWPTAWSSIRERFTASSRFTTVWQV